MSPPEEEPDCRSISIKSGTSILYKKPEKIPKTHKFWGLEENYLLHSSERPKYSIFKHFVNYLSLTRTIL